MRFDEPDVRDAYRRGARDCYEVLLPGLKVRRAREVERGWLRELDAWQEDDPPPSPLG